MKCYLCDSSNNEIIHHRTRDNEAIKVLQCKDCSLVYLSSISHVDIKLYAEDGQHQSLKKSPVAIPIKSYDFDTEKRYKMYHKVLHGKTILDFGCGEGQFIKKLKHNNVSDNIYALEPNKNFKTQLTKEFNYLQEIGDVQDESIDFITLFHVMEHLPDPITTLNSFYKKLKKGGKIIVEVPHSEDALIDLYEKDVFKNFTYWSLHLYLFNRETVRRMVKKTKYKLSYFKYYQRYPISNTLFWLAKGKPKGQEEWFFLDNENLNNAYEQKLVEIGKTDSLVFCLEK